ncbi:hypothetical protein ABII15_38960 (plasmid) [Streptomyces sp. HUAS MG91]|uniref:Uncharacterized protein n=1 Tax=Streptomyces tabacisoli TaxID=3156398 RepID=A0AAU8J7K1_9ACTN
MSAISTPPAAPRTRHHWRTVADWYGLDPAPTPPADPWALPTLTPTSAEPGSPPRELNALYRTLQAHDDGDLGLGAEGVRFVRAKGRRVLDVDWKHDTLLIDTLHATVLLDGQHLTPDRAALRRVLTDGVRRLVVVAHGDGGHLDLGPLVACGLYTPVERDLASGAPLERGCRAGVSCKRARDHDAVLLCRDIKAGSVVLVACKAGSIIDPAFPSSTNVVVGFLDGYAATVVAPPGNASASPVITHGLYAMAGHTPLTRVRSYLDDVSGRGRVHYRILGTPGPADTAPGDDTPHHGGGVTVHHVDPPEDGERHFALRVSDGTALRPGVDSAYGRRHLVLPEGLDPDAVRLVPDWTPRAADLDNHRTDLERMRLMYGQLTGALVSSPARRRALELGERLAGLRHRHEASRLTAVRRLAGGAAHGLVTHPGGQEATRQLLDAWGEGVAETLELLLVQQDPADLLTSAMWPQDERLGQEGCEVCGRRMRVLTYRDLLGSTGCLRHDCPHCGSRRVTPDRTDSCVTFRLVPGPDPSLEVNPETEHGSCHVVWQATFKNSATAFPVRRTRLGNTPERLPLPVPDDLTDQLHTVKAVVVSGSRMWSWRTRWRAR